MFAEETPIFLQLARRISNEILSGVYPEGSAVPSASDYALFYRMNPATAGKGVNVLVEQGILFKKRGVGMFVSTGAQDLLRSRRRAEFTARYLDPLVDEAQLLGIDPGELASMIARKAEK